MRSSDSVAVHACTVRAAAIAALACVAATAAVAAPSEHAHEHGVAQLNIGVEAKTLVLQFESPLANLLGFERAPRSDAERRQAAALVATLKAGASVFQIDPAARCVLARVELSSAALQLGPPAPSEAGHADIDGSFEFTCADAGKAAFVDVALFQFARLQKIAVQVATPAGQFRRDLQRDPAKTTARIVLTK